MASWDVSAVTDMDYMFGGAPGPCACPASGLLDSVCAPSGLPCPAPPPPPPYAPACSSGAEFTAVMQAVDDVCCEPTDQEGDVCTDGRLLACGTACARIVGPMYVQCEAFLRSYDSSILALMDAARAVCELAGH